MTAAANGSPADVMVCWLSFHHSEAPLVTALGDPGSPLRGKIKKLYLCWRDAPTEKGRQEREVLSKTKSALKERLAPVCPDIVPVAWKTDAQPIDHAAIRPFAERVLLRARKENPAAHVYIHLSPGTPAMHAVWLVLGTTGFIDGQVSLLQTVSEADRGKRRKSVQLVDFSLDTWLRHFRRSRPRAASHDDDGRIWDPAQVKSQLLREALQKLSRWAPLRVPVLLLGERGTGKTTMANFLRASSPYQRPQPNGWPMVVCGQFRVNPQLARSELFGHVKGAFTGATKDRPGLLERADKDTLFLDEIADIDRDTQRLLMAAIEGRGFQRLGEAKMRHSRFRLVSATNRSLDDLKGGGVLDRDFCDRVAVFVVEVPPLRRCREDIPYAWARVLSDAVKTSEVLPAEWRAYRDDVELLDGLREHDLPGNFRDLQRAAFHLVAALHADMTRSEAISEALGSLGPSSSTSPVTLPSPDQLSQLLPLSSGLDQHLAEYEHQWHLAAMSRAKNKQAEAARLLGLPRRTFGRRWNKS